LFTRSHPATPVQSYVFDRENLAISRNNGDRSGVDSLRGEQKVALDLRRAVVAAGLALFCTVSLGKAQAANLLASEDGDTAVLVPDLNWDVTAFTSTSIGESATGSGAFVANATATGMALVVLTEGPGGANSDWLELIYAGSANGDEFVQAIWNSDADPGGLPPLPPGVTPRFLAETGTAVDVTGLLGNSAGLSGFAFPSNITVQAQSDLEVVPAPLIGFGLPVFLAMGGVWFGAKLLARRPIYRNPAVVAGAPEPA
jgi:hypothetical protein